MANKPLTTTVIGSFPKPSYLPIEDWFDGARNDGGMNTERVTKEFTQYIEKSLIAMNIYLSELQRKLLICR